MQLFDHIEDESYFDSLKYTAIFIFFAYAFSFLIRMIWVYQFKDVSSFYWNDELMINTNDGYYFASAVQYLLYGMHEHNPQIQIALDSYPGVIYTTAFFAKILPVSLETVLLYMPAFISSLVVIPIILISRLFNMQFFGFLSALIGSIAWSYYNRTMTGYFDSDMFSVLMQMFVLYAFISLLVLHKRSNIFFAFIIISIYPLFYPQGLSLIYAMYFIYIIYALIAFRDDSLTFASIATIAIALLPTPFIIKLAIFAVLSLAYLSKKIEQKYWTYIALIAFGFFIFYAGVFSLIIAKITGYLDRSTEESGLHFFQVIQTVREAGQISFETMANRMSGSIVGVLAALIGYVVLVIKHRQFLIALPLIAIGVFSLWGGLRFTVYAVGIAAMSSVFLFYVLTQFIVFNKTRYAVIVALTAALLYPNITHIIGYQVPTVFTKDEVKILDDLKQVGSDKDYVIAWWDYGYPLWFYTNKNTLIDGGKHHHDNYIVSRILSTSSQLEAAQLGRLAVETYVSSDYKTVADTLFKNNLPDQLNVDSFIQNLGQNKIDLPQKSAEVFIYLPYRMMSIFPTVNVFSNLDLNSGNAKQQPFFYATQNFKDQGSTLFLGNGIALDKSRGIIKVGNQEVPLQSFITVKYDNSGKVVTNSQMISMNGNLSLVYMASYNQFLLLDAHYLNALYIQMFVFENYDKALFEPVILSPHAKVYKLKI